MKSCLLVLGLAGCLLAGCRKADVIDCALEAPVTLSSLQEFSRRHGVPTQTFPIAVSPATVPSSSPRSFVTQAGATIFVSPTGWVLPSGAAASGQAEVRVREIYSVADMVLSDMPTDQPYPGAMLVSGGEFNIQVRLGSQRLRLTNTERLSISSPIPKNQDTTRQLVWNRPLSLPTTSGMLVDSTGWVRTNAPAVQQAAGQYRAFLPLDSIGWWNIDQYWSRYYSSPQTTVRVTTPAVAAFNTRVYLQPSGVNGLARMIPSTIAGDSWTRTMPLGTTQTVIVLQFRNGQLYYGTQLLTVQAGLTITPPLAPVTEAQAVQLIRQL